jgi:hypothetical protein
VALTFRLERHGIVSRALFVALAFALLATLYGVLVDLSKQPSQAWVAGLLVVPAVLIWFVTPRQDEHAVVRNQLEALRTVVVASGLLCIANVLALAGYGPLDDRLAAPTAEEITTVAQITTYGTWVAAAVCFVTWILSFTQTNTRHRLLVAIGVGAGLGWALVSTLIGSETRAEARARELLVAIVLLCAVGLGVAASTRSRFERRPRTRELD